MTLNVGDLAPNFELVDTEIKMRTLDEFKGKKIILSFFVAASSPVCETELCTLRDSRDELSNLGAQVIAISNDGPFANKAFAEKNNLKFPILGDYKSKTIRDYDAAKRSIFIIDENGKISYKWVSDNPLVEPNYQEIKDFLSKGN
jgi:peroxiredoxin